LIGFISGGVRKSVSINNISDFLLNYRFPGLIRIEVTRASGRQTGSTSLVPMILAENYYRFMSDR
jgi:hypothetical protein